MPSVFRLMPAVAVLLLTIGTGCRKAPTVVNEVVAVPVSSLPTDPGDPLWRDVPEHAAALLLQDVVDPRLMKASTSEVRVRAFTDGSVIGFRLQWTDGSQDDSPGPGRAVDACAVQVPGIQGGELPSPQMGEANRPVEVTMWRADWQASVNGRGGAIKDLYPNAAVDHYPFQAGPLGTDSPAQNEMALRYAPAGVLGNQRNGPRKSPVEDMVADGPGTLKTEARTGSGGKGAWSGEGWAVVISRTLPQGLPAGARTQVAFAVWDGAQGEIGSRKMRTGWIPLLRRGE